MTDYLDPTPPVRRRARNDPYAEGDSPSISDEYDDTDDDTYENRELPSFLPPRLRAAIDDRRGRWTRVDTLAMAIIAAQLAVLFIGVIGGSLYLDDLRAQAYALDQPFWSFIMGSNGTHFAPLPRVLDWIQSRAFPLAHGPAIVMTLLVRLAFVLVFWRLLRRIFGPKMLTLVPLLLLVITPAMLPATVWYRQSITIVACTVAMLWALDAHLRWLLTRRYGALAELVLATAVGLSCYEKAVAIPIVLIGTTFALFARRGRFVRRRGIPTVLRPTAVSALLSGLVIGGFLLIYRSGPYDQGPAAGLPSVFEVVHLAWDVTTRDIVPLLFGGPYHWTFNEIPGMTADYAGTAHLSSTSVAIVVVITVVAVLLAALRRPSPTARGLLLLLAWLMPSVAIVAAGRFDTLGLILADSTRLWVDLVPAFVLAGALAVLPWQIGACRGARPDLATGATDIIDDARSDAAATSVRRTARAQARVEQQDRGPSEITIPGIALGLALAVIAVGSGVSTASYLSRWWDNPTGDYLANMRTTVTPAEPYARVLATPLPEQVMPAWVSSQLPTSAPLMQLLRSDLRFNDGDGDARALNSIGQLVPILKGPIAATKPAQLCVKKIPVGKRGYTGVPLASPAPYVPGAQIEVGLLLGEVTPVRVQVRTADGQRLTPQTFTSTELSTGAHLLHYPVPFGKTITGVYVQTNATEDGCIVSAQVWAPVTS